MQVGLRRQDSSPRRDSGERLNPTRYAKSERMQTARANQWGFVPEPRTAASA